MPQITYIQPDGEERRVDVPKGKSVMRGAIDADVDGVVAECGGNAMCATCHVYVVDSPTELPAIATVEDEMLECAVAPREEASRLSCQIPVTDDLDGLTVRVADEQA